MISSRGALGTGCSFDTSFSNACGEANPLLSSSPCPEGCLGCATCESVGCTAGQSADRALQQLLDTLQDLMQWEAKVYRCQELLQLLERNKELRKRMESRVDFR